VLPDYGATAGEMALVAKNPWSLFEDEWFFVPSAGVVGDSPIEDSLHRPSMMSLLGM
jgi:hypothetical protein